jgi:ribonuclease Z
MHYSRVEPLLIIGPIGIKSFIETCITTSESVIGFEIIIEEYDAKVSQIVYSDNLIDVTAIPLNHRIPTMGFSIKENLTKYKINPEQIEKHQLKYHSIKQLKEGKNITLENGNILTPEEACFPKKKARRYVYLSDTVYDENLIPYIENAELIYHETTYLKDMNDAAIERMHSTTEHAALIAKKANVGRLIIGHYSSRYKDIKLFEHECQAIFPNTLLGIEGKKYEVRISD